MKQNQRKIICVFAMVLWLICGLHAGELRFLTINIWSGLDYQGTLKMGEYETKERREQRYQILLQGIHELDPDVIAVNEANKLPHYARRLARDLNFDQIHTIGNAGIKVLRVGMPSNLIEGDVLLARKALNLERLGMQKLSGDKLGIHSDILAFHFNETNYVIVGSVRLGEKTLYVANTHLYASVLLNEKIVEAIQQAITEGKVSKAAADEILHGYRDQEQRRLGETENLLAFIDEVVPADASLVLMGDFNDVMGSQTYRMIVQQGKFVDSFRAVRPEERGYTWSPQINSNIDPLQLARLRTSPDFAEQLKVLNDGTARRIDFIFIRNLDPQKILGSDVVLNQASNGIFTSDHFGVMTSIRLDD